MKLAIVTRSDGNIKEMSDRTHPTLKNYAKKCGADFIVLDHEAPYFHYRILKLYDLFEKYDRIISMDSDVLIFPDCPNLFEIVPEDKIGTVLEDKGTRERDRRARIEMVNEKFGNVGWREGYINTGVAVFSKCHRDIFKTRDLYMNLGYDDVYLGYWIHKLGYKIHELPYQLNHMRCFSEDWNGNPSKYKSFIIHYAGGENWKFDYNMFLNLKSRAIFSAIPSDTKSIADVGCGDGWTSRWLKGLYEIYPIDIENTDKCGVGVLKGDITDLKSFPVKKVDVSICSEVLEHIKEWRQALKNLIAITEKKVIITVPWRHSYSSPDHINFWNDDSVEEFKEIAFPHKIKITKRITKPEDDWLNQMIYFIEITK